jgi:hypothetical protein
VAVGDEVYVVGNPQGLEGTFSQGIVSSVRQVGPDSLLQITAPISPGSSGGPVLSAQGKVIGVAVATFRGGQNLNFAVPASYLTPLLANHKPASPLSGTIRSGQARSIMNDLGGRSTEGVVGSAFTWQNELFGFGDFSFSLQNRLRDPVGEIYCLVIFYDRGDSPLDVAVVRYPGVVPAGLGKRVTGTVDSSVKRLTTRASPTNQFLSELTPSTRIELRVLDFKLME